MSRKKNALKKIFLSKALSLIDSELELFHLRIQYPERFLQTDTQPSNSDLHIIPESKDLGILGLVEIILGLHLSGEIIGKNGKPAPLIRIARIFEQAFNVDLGRFYKKKGAIYDRKPCNHTKGLEYLAHLVHKEYRRLTGIKMKDEKR
jgi:hypothetical protein